MEIGSPFASQLIPDKPAEMLVLFVRRQINIDFVQPDWVEDLAHLGFRIRGPSVHFMRSACYDRNVEFLISDVWSFPLFLRWTALCRSTHQRASGWRCFRASQ